MLVYAQQYGITIPEDYRFRETFSGLKAERPQYEKIRELISTRRIKVLIVYSTDRHTRDEVHGEIFDSELRRANCQLHVVTRGGQVDIYSASGRLLNTIERAFSKYWAQMIQQTTQEKKQAYLRDGIPVVQGYAPYGFERVGKKREAHLEIVEEEATCIRNLFTWFYEGVGVSEIRRRISRINRATAVTANSHGKRIGYYRCNTQHRPEWRTDCTMSTFRVDQSDAVVWDFTKALLSDERAIDAALRESQRELRRRNAKLYERIETIEEEIEHNTKELERLTQAFAKTDGLLLDMLKRQAEPYIQLIQGLRAEKAKILPQLQEATISNEYIETFKEFAQVVGPRLEQVTFEEKRQVIEALKFTFEMVLADEEKIIIVYWHTYQFKLSLERGFLGGLASFRNGG